MQRPFLCAGTEHVSLANVIAAQEFGDTHVSLAGRGNGRDRQPTGASRNDKPLSIAHQHLTRSTRSLIIQLNDADVVDYQAERLAFGPLPKRECAGPGPERSNLIANLLRRSRPIDGPMLLFQTWRFRRVSRILRRAELTMAIPTRKPLDGLMH